VGLAAASFGHHPPVLPPQLRLCSMCNCARARTGPSASHILPPLPQHPSTIHHLINPLLNFEADLEPARIALHALQSMHSLRNPYRASRTRYLNLPQHRVPRFPCRSSSTAACQVPGVDLNSMTIEGAKSKRPNGCRLGRRVQYVKRRLSYGIHRR
jgi:hypothetical protein